MAPSRPSSSASRVPSAALPTTGMPHVVDRKKPDELLCAIGAAINWDRGAPAIA
jgi:hypothetical protein